MRETTRSPTDQTLGRGPMHVGPYGEGELLVLARLLCAMVVTALGVGFLDLVISNAGGHVTPVRLASIYVVGVVASVFGPEVFLLAGRLGRGR